jgi:hypothetical protein
VKGQKKQSNARLAKRTTGSRKKRIETTINEENPTAYRSEDLIKTNLDSDANKGEAAKLKMPFNGPVIPTETLRTLLHKK